MNMIFPGLYEELDMQRYAKLVIDILPHHNVKIALCDDSGDIVWANEDKNKLKKLTDNCNERPHDVNSSDDCICEMQTHDGVNVIHFNLGELADCFAGELVFYDFDNVTGGKDAARQIMPMLSDIVEILKAELGYLHEVNSMARELGERYDEISMLRASDLELLEYHESRHILSTYIRSCTDHLNVDYAAIWLPSRQAIYPGGVRYHHDLTEIASQLEQLSVAAYEMFQNGHNGFGINAKNEDLRREIQLPADKKVLLVPVLNGAGEPCGVLCCLNEFCHRDFTTNDQSTLEAVARKTYKYLLNTQDDLTDLLNRKGFEESLLREISHKSCERYLVLFNIDQFKVINAAYGMTMGDIVLSSLAKIISKPSQGLKFSARLGSDTFAALIETSRSDVEGRVNDICKEIDEMVTIVDGKKLSVTSRAGIIVLNPKDTTVADHLYAAEMALTSAKEESNVQVVVYHPGNSALLKRQNQLTQVESIKAALEEDRFELYCQRIEPLTGDEIHYEILVRMVNESGELVAPDDFIPVAERYNLMPQVDRWIIKHTFQLLRKEEYQDISCNFKWGINLSGMTIGDHDFLDFVSNCLNEFNFQPTNLYFEITETAAIKNFQNCISFMNAIHSMGVQFALDDFGSGLSSFGYLKKLSIDYLKIDGSLVKDIVSSRLDQTMVSSIADIAKVLNVKTIGEYVENEMILDKLKSFNIDFVQGYGIMRPRSLEFELKSLSAHSKCKMCSNN
jgi:diguanylate cyclase (GGDEF)-like protein